MVKIFITILAVLMFALGVYFTAQSVRAPRRPPRLVRLRPVAGREPDCKRIDAALDELKIAFSTDEYQMLRNKVLAAACRDKIAEEIPAANGEVPNP